MSRSNILLLIIVAIIIIGFRLHFDAVSMETPEVVALRESQQTYITTLRIVDEPDSQPYSTSVVAIDQQLQHRILVRSTGNLTSLISSAQVGDVVSAKGALQPLGDFQTYRFREHIIGVFVVEEVLEIHTKAHPVERIAQLFRDRIISGCSSLSDENRGVCEGLLIGEKNHITRELYNEYRDSQLTHLLVASGSNIAFMIGFITPVLNRRSRNIHSTILIVVAVFYCVITRFEPSMLRACVMVIAPAVYEIYGVRKTSHLLFFYSILGCLILDPFLLFRLGFWLSAAATAGLRFFSKPIHRYVHSETISNTVAATISVQPVLWIVFGFKWPMLWWISVLAVMVTEPLVTFGMVSTSVASFLPGHWILRGFLMFPIDLSISFLNYLARYGGSSSARIIGIVCSLGVIFAYTYWRTNGSRDKRGGEPRVKTQCFLYYR